MGLLPEEKPMKEERNTMFTYINTLYAATPSSPENLISWKLKSMATIEEEVLERSSENPFEALRFISFQSSFV